jgi:hypothetical protein
MSAVKPIWPLPTISGAEGSTLVSRTVVAADQGVAVDRLGQHGAAQGQQGQAGQ